MASDPIPRGKKQALTLLPHGPEHVALIPNLPPLHAVAFGPWGRSQQPVVFAVPFDPGKFEMPEGSSVIEGAGKSLTIEVR